MAAAAHPDTMKPRRSGATRTATPARPDGYPWSHPRYRSYVLYAATSIVFLLTGFILLRGAWALGTGAAAWEAYLDDLRHPIYLVYHAFVVAMTVWFGWRTYFKLFAKTQPPRFGPVPRPPLGVFPPALALLWAGVTLGLVFVLGGMFP